MGLPRCLLTDQKLLRSREVSDVRLVSVPEISGRKSKRRATSRLWGEEESQEGRGRVPQACAIVGVRRWELAGMREVGGPGGQAAGGRGGSRYIPNPESADGEPDTKLQQPDFKHAAQGRGATLLTALGSPRCFI